MRQVAGTDAKTASCGNRRGISITAYFTQGIDSHQQNSDSIEYFTSSLRSQRNTPAQRHPRGALSKHRCRASSQQSPMHLSPTGDHTTTGDEQAIDAARTLCPIHYITSKSFNRQRISPSLHHATDFYPSRFHNAHERIKILTTTTFSTQSCVNHQRRACIADSYASTFIILQSISAIICACITTEFGHVTAG